MTDVRGARIVRLIEDPLVGGDLLLVAIGMAAKYDFGLQYGATLNGLAEMLWSTRQMSAYRLSEALRRDARTYRPPQEELRRCSAPMLRREGMCGRNATMAGYLTDWGTGEKRGAGGCSRHMDWYRRTSDANWAARPSDPPLPCANHGGALVSHFPRIDWCSFWRRLDPRWVEHPEFKPWPKPDLTLLLGDTEPERDGPAGSRSPLLAVVGASLSVLPEEKP